MDFGAQAFAGVLCKELSHQAGLSRDYELAAQIAGLAARVLTAAKPPPFSSDAKKGPPNLRAAQELAKNVRQYLRIKETTSLFDLLPRVGQEFGILAFPEFLSDSQTVSLVGDGQCLIFLAKKSDTRTLELCAHALAHVILLHAKDSRTPRAKICSIDRKPNHPMEHFANAFAQELLMPPREVAAVIKEVRRMYELSPNSAVGDIEISLVARIFGVSFLSAARRCEKLKLIPSGGAVSLDDYLRVKYGDAERRGDMLDLPPRPELDLEDIPGVLVQGLIDAIESGRVKAKDVQQLFPRPLHSYSQSLNSFH